jgi:hypothetical protein
VDVRDAGLALVGAGQREHLVGHVEAVGGPGGADAARGEQDVDAAAGAEVEDGLSGAEVGDGGGVAAPERGEEGLVGEAGALVVGVDGAAEEIGLLVGDDRCVGAAAAGRGVPGGRQGGRGVAGADGLAELVAGG